MALTEGPKGVVQQQHRDHCTVLGGQPRTGPCFSPSAPPALPFPPAAPAEEVAWGRWM